MEPVTKVFNDFIARVATVNRQALSEGDVSVIAALSSFRWLLLLLGDRIPDEARADSFARRRLERLQNALEDADDSLRLLPLFSHDTEAGPLMVSSGEHRLQWKARNAFTLLAFRSGGRAHTKHRDEFEGCKRYDAGTCRRLMQSANDTMWIGDAHPRSSQNFN